MADSMKTLDEAHVKRIHSNRPSGKLHKGHNITAATASIPSKYQTIVVDNSERKGFNSRSRRFCYDDSDNPGPGNYVGHHQSEKLAPSFSKKGTGGFASKDRRIMKHDPTCSPGSGAYTLPSMLSTRREFNRAESTSVFHKPIAQVVEKKNQSPAPNQYDALRAQIGRTNNVCADAAFKSRSKREILNVGDAKTKPAPWQYHIKEDLVRESVKVPFSSFKSKSNRRMQADPAPNPGPGTYNPHEETDPVPRTVFPRKHYLCISAPAMPLPNTPPLPGPGSYEMVNYEGPDKHYMSSAVFVSTAGRWTGDVRNIDIPGPAHYQPVPVGKQSFIYNASSRWI